MRKKERAQLQDRAPVKSAKGSLKMYMIHILDSFYRLEDHQKGGGYTR